MPPAPKPRPEKMIPLPVFPGLAHKQVELTSGYEFGTPRGNRVDVVHKRTREKQATLQCVCPSATGTCTLKVEDKVAFCVNDTCIGCTFKVEVPQGAFASHLGAVFKP